MAPRLLHTALLFLLLFGASTCSAALDLHQRQNEPAATFVEPRELPPPNNVVVEGYNSSALYVTWDAVTPTPLNYIVYVVGESGVYDMTDNTFCIVDGRDPCTTYQIEVKYVDATSAVSLPGSDSGTTLADAPPPAPQNVTVSSVTGNTVEVTWTEPNTSITKDCQVALYKVTWSTTGSSGEITTSNTWAEITDLPYYTTVDISVQAKFNDTDYGTAGSVQATTDPSTVVSPDNVVVKGNDSYSLYVSWDPADPAPLTYSIYVTGEGPYDATENTFTTVGGRDPCTTYQIQVRSYDGIMTSDPPGIDSGTTLPDAPPPAPQNVTVSSVTGNTVQVTWTEPDTSITKDCQVALYKVTWNTTGSSGETTTSNTWAEITDLPYDTTVDISVQAKFNDTDYGAAGSVQATTDPSSTDLVSPDNVVVEAVTAHSLYVSWTAPAPPPPSYSITISGNGFYHTTKDTSIIIEGRDPATTYRVEVRSFDGLTTSDPPNNGTGTTPSIDLESPDNVVVEAVTAHSLYVSWSAPAQPPPSYSVTVFGEGFYGTTKDTSIMVEGRDPATTYQVEVRSFDGLTTSDSAVKGTGTTLPLGDSPARH